MEWVTMMNIEAMQIRIVKNLGEINEKRKEKLSDLLSTYFPKYKSDENFLFFYDPVEVNENEDEHEHSDGTEVNQGIIIFPNGVNFLLSNNSKPLNVSEILRNIFDILLLEPRQLGLLTEIIAKVEAKNSSFDESLNFLTQNVSFADVKGVGLNLFVDNDQFKGELKVEPYFENPKEFFVSFKVKLKEDFDLENLTNILENFKNELNARVQFLLLNEK
jgi:hypothetical protein